jgi:glycosyltransferase involved in cell wall biosynthesis
MWALWPMLTVIIPTFNSERTLAPTLAMLVQGAMSGLVREVVVADGGSTDATLEIADSAGCTLASPADGAATLGGRLKATAAAARAPWLLFLRPGTVLEVTWHDEAALFIDETEREGDVRSAAVFRKQASVRKAHPGVVLSFIAFALSRRAHPDQGLLIGRALYDEIGGHSATAADPEAEFLARLGRRRILTLRSAARR